MSTTTRHTARWATLLSVVLLLVAACGGGGNSTSGSGAGAPLVVATPSSPEGLDHDVFYSESAQQARTFLYDNLLGFDYTPSQGGLQLPNTKTDALVGRLAESWELSPDKKTLTIKLRHGVKSHAGNELTADDVQYTWDRGWDINGSSKFYGGVHLGITQPSWKVVDRYTWQITTPRPNSLLIPMMANNDLNIVDSTETKKHATPEDKWATQWATTGDAGFGPYKLKEWTPGSQVVVTAFDGYYRGKPPHDTIIFKTIPDGAQRAQLVQSGAIDAAVYVPPQNLDSLRSASTVNVLNTPGNAGLKLTLNNTMAPLNDPRVRQAINFAVNREALAKGVYYGFGTPMKGLVAPEVTGLNESFAYPLDIAKAKDLMAQAGQAGGFDLEITFDTTKTTLQQVAQALGDDLAPIGVRVKQNPVSAATYNSNVYTGAYQAALLSEFPIIPEIGYSLALVYPCGSEFDPSKYCNKPVDAQIQDGLAAPDDAARQQIWDAVQRTLMVDDPADAQLVAPGWQIATKKSVSNVAWLPWQSWDPFLIK